MIALALSLRNVRTFDEIDLDLPEGLLGIVGTNGSGKSTLVNSIEAALFGPDGRSFTDWCDPDRGDAPLQIGLRFGQGGEQYRVRRTFSPKRRGTPKMDLEHALIWSADGSEVDTWDPLTRESIAATQESLEDIIGLSRETFRASSFLAQGEAGLFAEAGARERKRILADAVGLGIWDEWLERAKAERKAAELKAAGVAGQIEQAAAEVEMREEIAAACDSAREDEKRAEAELAAVTELLGVARTNLAAETAKTERHAAATRELTAAIRATEQAETERERLHDTAVALAARLQTRQALQNRAAKADALEEERDAFREAMQAWWTRQRLTEDIATASRQAADLRTRAQRLAKAAEDALAQDEAICDRCQRPLDPESRQKTAASYMEEADALSKQAFIAEERAAGLAADLAQMPQTEPDASELARITAALDEAKAADRQLAALDEAQGRLDEAREQISRIDAGATEREQTLARARAVVAELGQIDPTAQALLTQEVENLQAEATRLGRARLEAARQTSVLDERLTRLDDLARSIGGQRKDLEALQDEADLLAALERACGPNGMPALILETVAIPQIEAEANRILEVLGGPARAVELRTLREKKTGGVSDTLDVVLLTDAGERDYSTFSGGERARVNLALRLALAQLLAQRKGADTGLLVLDELEYLDAEGTAALVTVLEGLRDRIRTIIVVSHVAELRDSLEQTIVLENVDGRSRVVESLAEPVAELAAGVGGEAE